MHIGVDGVARKVKDIYVGVDGIARRVKSGYVGVDGAARLFWTGESLPPKDTLENTSWADIDIVSRAGLAPSYWAVGDRKTLHVTEGFGIEFEIVGFGFDDLSDRSGKAGITLGSVDILDADGMNPTNTNADGWRSSALREDLNAGIYSDLLDILGSGIIKQVRKGCAIRNPSTLIYRTDDYVWLPSEYEVTAWVENADPNEWPLGEGAKTYPWFSLQANRKKKDGTTYVNWWTRSTNRANNTQFCAINTSGDSTVINASVSTGFPLFFCV